MPERQTQSLADNLRRSGRAQKLTTSARRGTGAASQLRGLFNRDLPMRKPSPDGLNPTRILTLIRQQSDAARHQDARQIVHRSQRHHHSGQSLIASSDAQHAFPSRQRPDQSPKNSRSIVPISQRIEHAGSPLRAPIARIGAISCKRNRASSLQLRRRRFHQEPNLPVPRMIPKGNRSPIRRPNASMSRKNQKFLRPQFRSIPPHPSVLSPAKQIPRRPFPQDFRTQRQCPHRPSSMTVNVKNRRIRSIKKHQLHGVTVVARASATNDKRRPTPISVNLRSSAAKIFCRLSRAASLRLPSGNRRLRRRQSRDRYSIGRARNVIHPHPVTKFHRAGLAAVFAANTDL